MRLDTGRRDPAECRAHGVRDLYRAVHREALLGKHHTGTVHDGPFLRNDIPHVRFEPGSRPGWPPDHNMGKNQSRAGGPGDDRAFRPRDGGSLFGSVHPNRSRGRRSLPVAGDGPGQAEALLERVHILNRGHAENFVHDHRHCYRRGDFRSLPHHQRAALPDHGAGRAASLYRPG